jgi:hypothetical protein
MNDVATELVLVKVSPTSPHPPGRDSSPDVTIAEMSLVIELSPMVDLIKTVELLIKRGQATTMGEVSSLVPLESLLEEGLNEHYLQSRMSSSINNYEYVHVEYDGIQSEPELATAIKQCHVIESTGSAETTTSGSYPPSVATLE